MKESKAALLTPEDGDEVSYICKKVFFTRHISKCRCSRHFLYFLFLSRICIWIDSRCWGSGPFWYGYYLDTGTVPDPTVKSSLPVIFYLYIPCVGANGVVSYRPSIICKEFQEVSFKNPNFPRYLGSDSNPKKIQISHRIWAQIRIRSHDDTFRFGTGKIIRIRPEPVL